MEDKQTDREKKTRKAARQTKGLLNTQKDSQIDRQTASQTEGWSDTQKVSNNNNNSLFFYSTPFSQELGALYNTSMKIHQYNTSMTYTLKLKTFTNRTKNIV